MGGVDMGAHENEAHHTEPHYLLKLHKEAHGTELDGAGIQAWLDWEMEALLWRVPVDIPRADLKRLIRDSAETLKRQKAGPVHESVRQSEILEEDTGFPGSQGSFEWPCWWEDDLHAGWDKEAGA